MRITNDVPITPVETKTKEAAAGDTFATLLALAGLTTTATPTTIDGSSTTATSATASGPGGSPSGTETAVTAVATDTPSDPTGEAAAAALADRALLTGPLLEITCALVGPTGEAPPLPSLGDSAAVASAITLPRDKTGTEALAAALDALASATVTTCDADGTPLAAPSTASTGTVAAPVPVASSIVDTLHAVGVDAGTVAAVTPAVTDAAGTALPLPGADAASTALPLPGAEVVATDESTPIDATIPSDASLAPTRNGPPVPASATDRPIAPTRMSEVMLAAARASAEADRPVRLTVRLDPPNLGEVRVELLARNGTVTVRVEPLHEAAAPLLSHQRQAVSDALGRSGFTMTSFDVAPGEPQRERATPTKRTVRVAEATAADEAPEATTTDAAGRLGLRI